ncbi:MAG: hypothetical protein N2F24_15575, partial [Deltaproteobacteria bacterium]
LFPGVTDFAAKEPPSGTDSYGFFDKSTDFFEEVLFINQNKTATVPIMPTKKIMLSILNTSLSLWADFQYCRINSA